MKCVRLGVDVGRCTTVAVLVRSDGTIADHAVVATRAAYASSLDAVLVGLPRPLLGSVAAVGVTTAELSARPTGLAGVAALRISPPCHPALAPLAGWPEALAAAVGSVVAIVDGGASLTGLHLEPLARDDVARFAARAAEQGVTAFAVTAAGAVTRPEIEAAAAEIIVETVPGARISLSRDIGRIGLRERENATVVNAALRDEATRVVDETRRSLAAVGVAAPLFFGRDTGGRVSAEYFRRFPVIASDSTTAAVLRGAARYAAAQRAVVLDMAAEHVRCGTVDDSEITVRDSRSGPGGIRLGVDAPEIETLSFDSRGGSAAAVPAELLRQAREDIGRLVARVRERTPGAPVIAAGGAAWMLPETTLEPWQQQTAAAYEAAASDIAAEVAQVAVAAGRTELERVVESVSGRALAAVIAAGAKPVSARIGSVAHAPVSYLPGGVHRIRVRAVGTAGEEAE